MRSTVDNLWNHPLGKAALLLVGLAVAYLVFRLTLPVWAGLMWVLRITLPVWSTFLLSLLFAYLLNPVVTWMEGRGVPRGIGVATLLVALVAILVGFWLLILTIATDLSDIAREAPGLVDSLRELPFLTARFVDPTYGDMFDQVFTTAQAWTQGILQNVLPSLQGAASADIAGQLSSLSGGGLQASMMFILTIFFLLRFELYKESMLALVPGRHRDGVGAVAHELGWAVGGYLRGQLFIALIVGILSYVGLAAIGVPLALVLGVLAGVLNIIPFFGPILVSIPTVLVAMTVGWPYAVGALAVLAVVNQLDAQVLSPIVFAHTVEVDPVTILLAIFMGTVLFGLLGALLAVPAAVMIRFFVRRTYFQSSWYRGAEEPAEASAS